MFKQLETLYYTLTDISFWINFLESFRMLGPIAPIFLAFIESIVPALPLIVIISFNVGAYGPVLGFLYSWLGTFFGSLTMFFFYRLLIKPYVNAFLEKRVYVKKIMQAVSDDKGSVLFIITLLPFTPSSLVNLVYGLSAFSKRKFTVTLFISKGIMVLFMTLFGHSLTQFKENPLYLVITVIVLIVLYFVSKKINKKYFEK